MLDQDPYWMHLIEEYRRYRHAWRYWSKGSKGVEAIMKLPDRQRDAVVDDLLRMRQSQGLPLDDETIFQDMRSNDDDVDEDDY